MKCFRTTFSTALSASLIPLIVAYPVSAGEFTVERRATDDCYSVRGEAPAPKVGNVFGTSLVLVIDDDKVQVQEVQANGIRKTLLSGVAFNLTLTKEEVGQDRMHGFCYFDGGEKLPELLGDDASLKDIVLTKNGVRDDGEITSVNADTIVFRSLRGTRKIAAGEIHQVVSSHVYTFTALLFGPKGVPIEDSPARLQAKVVRVEMDQTRDEFMTVIGRKKLEAAISTKEYSKTQKVMLIGGSLFLTLAAIALPVALAAPLAGRSKGRSSEKPEDNQLQIIER